MDLSEKETREKIIDPWLLRDAGWKEEYIKREVNSIKSEFKIKKYEFKIGGGKEEGRFIDYVLLDEHKNPLAIIEAKRFSLDAEKGSIQATTYQKDIESQTGFTVPIFLTNGQKWFYKEKGYPTREISGPFSQKDLQRRTQLAKEKQKQSNIGANPKIVDRSRSVEVVRQVLDHLEKGNRKALINMATGTGKTRVSMAIIEALIRARYIQNVLFVVDRISLGRQAYNAFDSFLRGEPKTFILKYKRFKADKTENRNHKSDSTYEYLHFVKCDKNKAEIRNKEFPIITWQQAMDTYGIDKPDLRTDALQIIDVSDIASKSDLKVFGDVVQS